ncbi:MAG: hypothetical protein KGJ79_09560 [Alphaproteobacteria bacterium]|nr:hypothetical protein [Alphaproteobacteria bacterium]MDE2111377.1 hypothetical protein [Alphaproteobacteria bacterium]MDE2495570.1 hypothetical protein [Alphaproteobacteria bacterium]
MWRTIAGVIVGFAAWMLIVTILNWGLRLWLPGYLHAEPAMAFTLAMKIARLSIAALTSLAAGALVRAIAPASGWAPWIVGFVLLVLFVPDHVYLWHKFPVWYHLTFLVTLAPLVALGGWLSSRGETGR